MYFPSVKILVFECQGKVQLSWKRNIAFEERHLNVLAIHVSWYGEFQRSVVNVEIIYFQLDAYEHHQVFSTSGMDQDNKHHISLIFSYTALCSLCSGGPSYHPPWLRNLPENGQGDSHTWYLNLAFFKSTPNALVKPSLARVCSPVFLCSYFNSKFGLTLTAFSQYNWDSHVLCGVM